MRRVTAVVHVPVSRSCEFYLNAAGDYGRKEVENFLTMLKLHLDLGAFDSESAPVETAHSATAGQSNG